MSPPEENRANYPYVKEGVGPVGGVQSESGFMGTSGLGIKPYTSFSYNPTLLTKPSPYSYSPLPSPATPTTSPRSFVHLGQLPMSPHLQVRKPHQEEASLQGFASPVAFPKFAKKQPSTFQPLTRPQVTTGGGGRPENVVRHLPVPHAQYLPTFAKEFAAAKEHARDHFAQVR